MGKSWRTLLRREPPPEAVIRKLVPEADEAAVRRLIAAKPYTMTSWERLWAFHEAVRYVAAAGIAGDIVECGVWRGGNLVLAGQLCEDLGLDRKIYAFDTFTGMSEPTVEDVDASGQSAAGRYQQRQHGDHTDWCYASLEDVRSVVAGATSYRTYRFVAGKCEDTLLEAENLPERIAVLRLDTDFYASTKAEIEVLYPRLVSGGVLIVDDFGHWGGARKAIEDYFRDRPIFLQRIDYTGRLHIKP